MPNCIQFINKKTGEAVNLTKLDEEIAAVIGVPVHPREWCKGWYSTIAFEAAMGRTYDQIAELILDYETADQPHLMPVLDHLRANYDISVWAKQ